MLAATAGMAAANAAANSIRAQAGYSGGSDGSQYVPINSTVSGSSNVSNGSSSGRGVNFNPNEGADWLRTGSGLSFEEFWGIEPNGEQSANPQLETTEKDTSLKSSSDPLSNVIPEFEPEVVPLSNNKTSSEASSAQIVIFVYNKPDNDFKKQAKFFANAVYGNKNVKFIYIRTYDEFIEEWNNLTGDIRDIHLFIHGWEGNLSFEDGDLSVNEIGKLNKVIISGTVGLWSCHGGTGGSSSVANAISGRVYGWPVVALVDGSVTYRDWYQPFIGFPLTKDKDAYWAVFRISRSGNGSPRITTLRGKRAPVYMFDP